ncbi:Ti-type conjugative transfer relaxase TraA [Muricoccus nepalensis]
MVAWSQFRMDASRHTSRKAGQSAVAAAAYRSGGKLYDEKTQQLHDYTRRFGVVESGLAMPEAGGPDWTREQLWNAAEQAEKRKDARTSRKVELALPDAMTAEQRRELVAAWAGEIANRYGVAVDWAIHLPDKEGDQRNHHAHLMMTTREVGVEGFRGKAALELSNTDQRKRGLLVGDDGIYALREALAERLNELAARHGLDLTADPRSYAARGVELEPTKHVGVHAVGMDRRGVEAERVADHAATRAENARRIEARPELVLDAVSRTEAVFGRREIARELHRYIDDAEQFRSLLARLEASPELVRLSAEGPALFSTRAMIAAEARMAETAGELARGRTHQVAARHAEGARARHAYLSAEQGAAVAHVLAPGQIAAVAGVAGAGKSAALTAAREAWEAQGYRVRGAALAGKAADGLQASAGIESRTLHALEYGWQRRRDLLTSRDVLVVDEAGMVGSRQLGRVLEAARQAGAKVVLVGDAEQLQPIEAGAAFRAITERIGVAGITEVRRQREAWAREATEQFWRGETREALAAYAERDRVRFSEDRARAKAALVEAWHADRRLGHDRLIMAHTNKDVHDLNALARAERQRAGELGEAADFRAERGARSFATGDRLVFLANSRELGVKNGTLATVERAEAGRLAVRLDDGRRVAVDQARYAQVDHGYAVTLHKSQGATVERAYVLASGGMNRHLAYVAMSRHRDGAMLFAGRDDFRSGDALAARLGRARPKESTLDFAERRGIETSRPWVENALALIERGRERLADVWERVARGLTVAKEKGGPVMERNLDEAQPTSRREQLHQAFGQEPAAPAGNDRGAQLREAFAGGGGQRSSREQLREALEQDHDTPDKPHRDMERGHGIA